MKIKTIPSKWLEKEGRRLDCGPYMSGAIEAKVLIEQLTNAPLSSLTTGYNGGIFKAPRLSPNYVTDPSNGKPYLSSTDILWNDMSYVSMISNSQYDSVRDYRVEAGMTLVSSSGETGRTSFARDDMNLMMGSPHFMRINPNTDLIPAGYLYAFLSSRFGHSLMVSGTYGSIIQAIEPHHVSELPVPRFEDSFEKEIDELVVASSNNRTRANVLINDAIEALETASGLNSLSHSEQRGYYGCRVVSSNSLNSRLDGIFHSSYHNEAVVELERSPHMRVTDIAESIFEPLRIKRVVVDDPEYGHPFYGTTEIMWAEPVHKYFVSKNQRHIESFIVSEKTVLIPRSGQLSGIIGTPVLPYGGLVGGAVSEHAIRINCNSMEEAGFIFIALKSEYGRRQLKARAYGSSIPTLDINQVGNVLIPDLGDQYIDIGRMAIEATQLRNEAIRFEKEAVSLVENAIKEGGR